MAIPVYGYGSSYSLPTTLKTQEFPGRIHTLKRATRSKLAPIKKPIAAIHRCKGDLSHIMHTGHDYNIPWYVATELVT